MQSPPESLLPEPSLDQVRSLLQQHPIPTDTQTGDPVSFNYGTAGFRYDASLLNSVMVRVGILAAHRSATLNEQHVGVMVTASHNDESYNGVKLSDPDGGMMSKEGEVLAIQLANAPSVDEVLDLVSSSSSDAQGMMTVVHIGRDTRKHSPALTDLVIQTARNMGATVLNHGIVTTPMLHHCVMQANPQLLPPLIPPRPNVSGYFDIMSHTYMALLATSSSPASPSPMEPLIVDCACGVGYDPVQKLASKLLDLGAKRPIQARNGPSDGPLNEGCGSEHVQKSVLPPKWYNESFSSAATYAASLDGDADRIVFFTQAPPDEQSSFSLLDGDKIAVLICDFLQEQVRVVQEAMAASESSHTSMMEIKLGVVQTAYANGASTAYLQQVLGTESVKFAKTGVKHVHAAAHHYFDVGVYFEANGHGTVLFSDKFYEFMARADSLVRGNVSLRRLQLLPSLVNQAVGDSLSDLLLVDAILQLKGWTIHTWDALYKDLPSRQCKVKVKDRTMIKTNENETRCLHPDELQDALDKLMEERKGRAFVRPSGTENVVRVYAEATTQQDADSLATEAAQLVYDLCGGTVDPPRFP